MQCQPGNVSNFVTGCLVPVGFSFLLVGCFGCFCCFGGSFVCLLAWGFCCYWVFLPSVHMKVTSDGKKIYQEEQGKKKKMPVFLFGITTRPKGEYKVNC